MNGKSEEENMLPTINVHAVSLIKMQKQGQPHFRLNAKTKQK